jgi:hypothetical protein
VRKKQEGEVLGCGASGGREREAKGGREGGRDLHKAEGER